MIIIPSPEKNSFPPPLNSNEGGKIILGTYPFLNNS